MGWRYIPEFRLSAVRDLNFPSLSELGKRKSAKTAELDSHTDGTAKKRKVETDEMESTNYFERATRDAAVSATSRDPEAVGDKIEVVESRKIHQAEREETSDQTSTDSGSQNLEKENQSQQQAIKDSNKDVLPKRAVDAAVQTMRVDSAEDMQQFPVSGTCIPSPKSSESSVGANNIIPVKTPTDIKLSGQKSYVPVDPAPAEQKMELDELIQACAGVLPAPQLSKSKAAEKTRKDSRQRIPLRELDINYVSALSADSTKYSLNTLSLQFPRESHSEVFGCDDECVKEILPSYIERSAHYMSGQQTEWDFAWYEDALTEYENSEHREYFGQSLQKHQWTVEPVIQSTANKPNDLRAQVAAMEMAYLEGADDLISDDDLDEIIAQDPQLDIDRLVQTTEEREEDGGWPPRDEREWWKNHIKRF